MYSVSRYWKWLCPSPSFAIYISPLQRRGCKHLGPRSGVWKEVSCWPKPWWRMMALIAYPFPLLCFLLALQDPAQKEDHTQKVDHRPQIHACLSLATWTKGTNTSGMACLHIQTLQMARAEWSGAVKWEVCAPFWQSYLHNNLKTKSKLGFLRSLRSSRQNMVSVLGHTLPHLP